ncbi:sugar transporter [Endogone sp. FLAS-F59071]|nr:sugar transporter [Endogone sp. FLAS-F59071]|eukprot:RUS22347.1 sugar transporter [Endogone sp. FLAS-F59071]
MLPYSSSLDLTPVCAISGIIAMPQFVATFPNISPTVQGLLVTIILLTSFIGCLFSGWLAGRCSGTQDRNNCHHVHTTLILSFDPSDKISRKRSIIVGSLLFAVGAAMETAGVNLAFLFVARAIAGLGGGILSNVVPMYHSEIAPAYIRGRLITLFQLAITLGICLGYFIDLGCQTYLNGDAAWRVPFAIQIVTSIALALGCLVLPYSPRWLIYQNREEEALAVLASMRADGNKEDPDVITEFNEIRGELALEKALAVRKWIELLRGTVLKRTAIGVFIQTFQQFTARYTMIRAHRYDLSDSLYSLGINGVLYFAPVIFQQAGLNSYTASLIATGVTGIVNVVFTIPALIWIDSIGRKCVSITNYFISHNFAPCYRCGIFCFKRTLPEFSLLPSFRLALISGAIIQGISMFIIGSLFAAYSTMDNLGNVTISSSGASWSIVAFIFVFIAGFAYSWGVAGTVYPAEIFPMRLRSKGMSITTGSNWLFNIVVSFITPVVLSKTTSGLYFAFGVCCVIMAIVCFFIPETNGKTLEEMEIVFGGGELELLHVFRIFIGMDKHYPFTDDPNIEKRAAEELGLKISKGDEKEGH